MAYKHYDTIYLDNSGGIVLDKYRDLDGQYNNSAIVRCTAITIEGDDENILGITLPINMVYVPASNGKYRGVIGYTAQLIPGIRYSLKIVADTGTLISTFNHKCVARERLSS